MTIARINKASDSTWARSWEVADAAELATLLATYTDPLGPKRGDIIVQLDTGIIYLLVGANLVVPITGLAVIPVDLTTDVTGVLPTANGGTSVDIASAALPLGSGQITFPATQNPSSGANVLDDYEEGTWTPTVECATPGDFAPNYVIQVGFYTKIGNRVYLDWVLVFNPTFTTASGIVSIAGLPFTSANLGGGLSFSWGSMQWGGIGFSLGAGFIQMGPRIYPNTVLIRMIQSGNGVASLDMQVNLSMVSGVGNINLSGSITYQAVA